MTPIEKRALILLIFFAVLGSFIRLYRARGGQVRFEVIPAVEAEAARKGIEARRLKALLVDVNAAGASEFEDLPEVGPKLAAAIVAHREANGPFGRVQDIVKVPGFGTGRYNKIRDRLSLNGKTGGPFLVKSEIEKKGRRHEKNARGSSTSQVPAFPIDINRASVRELESLPKIGPALAKRIVARRQARGRFGSFSDLSEVKGLGPSVLKAIEPHIAFGTD